MQVRKAEKGGIYVTPHSAWPFTAIHHLEPAVLLLQLAVVA